MRGLIRFGAVATVAILLLAIASSTFADTLAGRVLTVNNLPIPNAEVLVFRALRLEATLPTDAAGRFGPKALPAGSYEIVVAVRGFVAAPMTVTLGPADAPVEITITMTESPISEYVVVTAPPLGAEALAGVSRLVTVFDRSDLVMLQAESLADVLRLVPGLNIQARGGAGALTTLSAWGGAPEDVLVLVDGVPQNLFGGAFDAAHLGTADIDHIAVLRGADSVVTSMRAPSAIVHVTTRGGDPARLDVTAEGGFEPSGRVTVSAGNTIDRWAWAGAGEWLNTRGQNGRVAASGATVTNDDYLRANASGSLTWRDQPERFIRLHGRASHTARGYPGPWGSDPLGLAPGVDTVSRGRTRTGSVGLSALTPSAQRLIHRVDASWSRWRDAFSHPAWAQDIATRRFLLHYHLDAELTRTTLLTTGIEREWERATDTLVRDSANTPLPLTRAFASYFGELRQSIGTRVFLSGGLRYDISQRGALAGNDTPDATRPALEPETRHDVNGRLQGALVLWRTRTGASATLRASGGSAMVPPTAEEIGFSDNPSLRPERSTMVSGGFEIVGNQQRLTLTAEGFGYRFNDLIVPVIVQRGGVRRIVTDNIARAEAYGATVNATVRLPGHIVVRGGLTHLSTHVLDGPALVRRPALAGSASVVWARGHHSGFVTVGGRGSMLDVEPSRGEEVLRTAGYAVVSAGASVSVGGSRAQVFARANNLLDRQYEEILGYPAPRRAFIVGIRLSGHP